MSIHHDIATVDSELIARYKRNYGIPEDAVVTEEMILAHWKLEKRLTRELLASDDGNRREIFEKCYSELYRELKWLNDLVDTDEDRNQVRRFEKWQCVIGAPPQKIYEVGSGRGDLILYLAQRGFTCKATEVTRERGSAHMAVHPNLSWGTTDGVHLDRFESRDTYDVVISNQVIEHLHPDDLGDHFRGAYAVLMESGRYIFNVPHRCAGPADISSVFGCDEPGGMHLREYTYGELRQICLEAGFKKTAAVLSLPVKVEETLGWRPAPVVASFYLGYVQALESVLLLFPPSPRRRRLAKLMRFLCFDPNIFMVALK